VAANYEKVGANKGGGMRQASRVEGFCGCRECGLFGGSGRCGGLR